MIQYYCARIEASMQAARAARMSNRSPNLKVPRSRKTLTICDRAIAHKFFDGLQDRTLNFFGSSQPKSTLDRQDADQS